MSPAFICIASEHVKLTYKRGLSFSDKLKPTRLLVIWVNNLTISYKMAASSIDERFFYHCEAASLLIPGKSLIFSRTSLAVQQDAGYGASSQMQHHRSVQVLELRLVQCVSVQLPKHLTCEKTISWNQRCFDCSREQIFVMKNSSSIVAGLQDICLQQSTILVHWTSTVT